MPALPRRAMLLGLLALAGCHGLAYREATRSLLLVPQPMDLGLDARILPSGLRFAVFQVPGQRDATVSLAMGGGEADEPDGKAGLARVALRAALAAPRGPGGATVEEGLYAAGALPGTWLVADETLVSVRYRRAFEEQVLSTLAGFLADPAGAVDEEAVRRAREGFAAELESRAGTLEAATVDVRRLALAGTPLGRPAPTPAGVRALTVADVRAYLRASLVPARSTLWFSTGHDAEQEAQRLLRRLGPVLTGDPARPVPLEDVGEADEPPRRLETRWIDRTGGKEPRLLLAWRGPGLRSAPAAARAAGELRNLLGHRAAGPDLTDHVRVVNAWIEAYDRASVAYIEVVLEHGADVAKVRRAMVETSRRPSTSWQWPGEANEVFLQRELRLDRELELAHGWVGDVGRLVRVIGSADMPAWLDHQERSQMGAPARAWLDAWITPGPAVVATIAPDLDVAAAAPAREAEDARPPAPGGGSRVWATAPNPYAAAVPGLEQIDRLLEPDGLEAAHRERLPNGVEALVLRRPAAPFAFVTLSLPGGAVQSADGLAATLALEQAHARLRAGGCGLAPEARRHGDGVTFQLHGPAAWLPALVEGVACWGQPLESGGSRLPSPDEALPWLAYDAAMTGGPIPEPGGGKRWAEAYLVRLQQTERAVVVVTGDVEPAATMALLREAFGRFPARPAPPPRPSWPRPGARRVILEDVPGATRASASLFLRLPDGLPLLQGPSMVLSTLLDDLASRTFTPSGLEVRRHSAVFGESEFLIIGLEGAPGLVPAAAGELLLELRRLRDAGPSRLQLDAARWDTARSQAYGRDAAPGAAYALRGLASAGLPLDTWNGLGARLRQVDGAAVQALLRRSAVGGESILLRGDAATLLPLLRQEGLQPEVLAPPAKTRAAGPSAAR